MARVAITTFGCQMNRHDSDRMAELLAAAGHRLVSDDDGPEVVVLNTCSVRDKAEHKLRSELGRWLVRKRRQPDLVLVVAGCVASARGDRLLAGFPGLDLVIGPDQIPVLPALIRRSLAGASPQVRTDFDVAEPAFLATREVEPGPTAYVTTAKGCSERCSFCVVPGTRGPERHRPSGEIVAEIEQLTRGGCREVTLLGQTVNRYVDPSGVLGPPGGSGRDRVDAGGFAGLLRHVAERVPALVRLRYEAPHPRYLSDELIAAHRDLSVLCRHVHLPVQSGSDRVLRRMVRRHTRAEYLDRVARLRDAVADLTLSTDVIVGFPGETEEDFRQTLSLVEEVGFAGLYGFTYSPRPDTPALRLGDPVSEAVKARRLQELFALSEQLLGDHLRGLVGTVQSVLVAGGSKRRPDHPSGRTGRNEIVHLVEGDQRSLAGRIVAVEIVEALGHSLRGRVVPEGEAAGGERPPADRARPVRDDRTEGN